MNEFMKQIDIGHDILLEKKGCAPQFLGFVVGMNLETNRIELEIYEVPCDCGGTKARTTHSDWCNKSAAQRLNAKGKF